MLVCVGMCWCVVVGVSVVVCGVVVASLLLSGGLSSVQKLIVSVFSHVVKTN